MFSNHFFNLFGWASFGKIAHFPLRLRTDIVVRRGKMAADEEGRSRENEPLKLDLTITEDHDISTNEIISNGQSDEVADPYKNGFGLAEYYKLCLTYYHKGWLSFLSRVIEKSPHLSLIVMYNI